MSPSYIVVGALMLVACGRKAKNEVGTPSVCGDDSAWSSGSLMQLAYDADAAWQETSTAATPGTKGKIRGTLRGRHEALTTCLASRSSLAGTVTVSFAILEGSRVQNVSATGLGDAAVEKCFAAAVEATTFTLSKAEAHCSSVVKVSYPFVLTQGK